MEFTDGGPTQRDFREGCRNLRKEALRSEIEWRRLAPIADGARSAFSPAQMTPSVEREFNELIKELKVSHAGFYHERRPRAAGNGHQRDSFQEHRTTATMCWVFQDVHPGGAAFKAGIQPGDILLRVGETEVRPPEPSVVSAWRSNARGHLPARWHPCPIDRRRAKIQDEGTPAYRAAACLLHQRRQCRMVEGVHVPWRDRHRCCARHRQGDRRA